MEARSQLQRALAQQSDDEQKFLLERKRNTFLSAKKNLPEQLPSSLPQASGAASLSVWGGGPESSEFMIMHHPIINPESILKNSIAPLTEGIKAAKAKGDKEMNSSNDNEVEATINASVITGNIITTANVGDSRAMLLFKRKGENHFSCMRLSFDHTFMQADEEERAHIKESRKKKIGKALESKKLYHSDNQVNYTRILGRETLSDTPTVTHCDLSDFHEAYLINVTGGLASVMQEKHIAELVTDNKKGLDESENPAQFLANFLRDEVKERSRDTNSLTILVTDVSSYARNKEVSILAFVSDGKNGDNVSQFVKRHFVSAIEAQLSQQVFLNEDNEQARLQDNAMPSAGIGEKQQQSVDTSIPVDKKKTQLHDFSSNPNGLHYKAKKPAQDKSPVQINNNSCQLI